MKKVLVVDDNASNLMLEKDLLEVAGFEAFGAENAAGGIAIAMKEKPDIIIMDVRLPDMRAQTLPEYCVGKKKRAISDCFCDCFGNGRED